MLLKWNAIERYGTTITVETSLDISIAHRKLMQINKFMFSQLLSMLILSILKISSLISPLFLTPEALWASLNWTNEILLQMTNELKLRLLTFMFKNLWSFQVEYSTFIYKTPLSIFIKTIFMNWLYKTKCLSFVGGCLSLVVCHWLLIVYHCLLIVDCWLLFVDLMVWWVMIWRVSEKLVFVIIVVDCLWLLC
jgi:hypothetical protein